MLSSARKNFVKDKIKQGLGILSADFDAEILEQINAGEFDLKLAGVEGASNPLYEQAIVFYVKAYLRPDSNFDRYIKAFERLSKKLALAKISGETQNVQS